MNEKISRFLDNDLSQNETLNLLEQAAEQPELKEKLKRYAAVSHAIKTDNFSWVADDFAARVHQEIHQVYPVVTVLPASRRHYWLGLAVASTAAIAVFAGGGIDWSIKLRNDPATLQIARQATIQRKPATTAQTTYKKAPHQFNARINDYLQEHNNSGYSNGESFVRLANYSK
jgi:sigma-E factor negative regulatory protein RseA